MDNVCDLLASFYGRDSSKFWSMLWVRDLETRSAYSTDYGGNIEIVEKVLQE